MRPSNLNGWFLAWLKQNGMTLFAAILAIVVAWTTLNFRVMAVEKELETLGPLIPRFIVVEERTGEILKRIERIEGKLDALLERR